MQTNTKLNYKSLEDFLVSKELSVDAELEDGLGARYSVKGREIEATILFADISLFAKRTQKLSPTSTMIYLNRFFTWITNEALKGVPCIIDKYIGDKIMIIFSGEFGSENHFFDAVKAARWFAERDILRFQPHMGIASGVVTVGHVGTPMKYSCSVFGNAVTIASRCSNLKINIPNYASILFPADHWKDEYFSQIFEDDKNKTSRLGITGQDMPLYWKELPIKKVRLKNIGGLEVKSIVNLEISDNVDESDKVVQLSKSLFAEDEAEADLKLLHRAGKYTPISERDPT